MPKDYISTDALHGLDYLAHARVYSHKYIRREPDGHGGYRYYYPTDISTIGVPGKTIGQASSYRRYDPNIDGPVKATNAQVTIPFSSNRGSMTRDQGIRASGKKQNFYSTQHYREADKASQIYRENLTENKLDTKTPNIAQQAISTITTAARNTYEAGMNFLKKLFSTPIITTKKNITVTETRGEFRNPGGR